MNTIFIDKLRSWFDAWSSVEIRCIDRYEHVASGTTPGAPPVSYESHYIETAAGERYYEGIGKLQDGTATRSLDLYDGQRALTLSFDRTDHRLMRQMDIKSAFAIENRSSLTMRPPSLQYLYVLARPLHAELNNAVLVGQSTVLNRPCRDFLMEDPVGFPDRLIRVLSLDESSGLPLRAVLYRSQADREQDRPISRWEATKLASNASPPLVTQSRIQGLDPAHPSTVQMAVRNQVQSFTFNQFFPRETFSATPAPGTMVVDGIKRTIRQEPGEPAQTTAAGPPIRVRNQELPPVFLSTALIAAGLLILLCAWILRKRG